MALAKDRLPDEKLLELDDRDECPLDIVRGMCGSELGIQLLFIPDASPKKSFRSPPIDLLDNS